jgi:D-lactate dehydrogenase
MKTAVFSSKLFDETSLRTANDGSQQLDFFKVRLEEATAVLAKGYGAVCVFVNDRLDGPVVDALADAGVRLIALRCAGYNNVDLNRAQARGLCVVRVPAYSPHAVAEFAAGLLLALNRRLYKAYNRVREGNFELQGLMGFDLYEKTVTVIGSGKIGAIFAQIMHGFGCRLLAADSYHNPDVLKLGATYLPLAQALPQSDVISLHCPLTPETHHLISEKTLEFLKPGMLLVNTGRGALLDSRALIVGLKSGVIGGLALDVYEEEDKLFFDDHSAEIIPDDTFMRLTTFPNVLITGHQAFFTKEALEQIARTTIANLKQFEASGKCGNAVAP